MRAASDAALPGTAVLHRNTLSSDGMGGQSSSWAAYGTVACRVAPGGAGGGERIAGGEFQGVAPFVITVPYNTDLTHNDRVVYGGSTYEVLYVDAPRSWAINLRAAARVVD